VESPSPRRASGLRLPEGIEACLFDLDGILTTTVKLHAEAWKATFDELLHRRAERRGEDLRPFDERVDYQAYVDGKHRSDGIRSFLGSRGIQLPEGDPRDGPDGDTVVALGNRKNTTFLSLLRERGLDTYPGSVRFARAARAAGLRTAVVSASHNCQAVLQAAGIEDLFEVRVDGLTLDAESLSGKPAPDSFLAAARKLGVEPRHAAVFEDARAGVAAGRAGGFGFVVGVDRGGNAEALSAGGADAVVSDLAELLA
jgi:beta-phosphoglucomutase family hydrolase